MTTVVCIETDADSTTRVVINDSKIDSQVTITPKDVDTRWPFRAGYPRLLRPSIISLPINEAEKPISNANFEDLKSRIDSILETYNILRGIRSPRLVYRRQRYGTLSLPRVVVDCTYDKETSHSKMWARDVIKIYTAIQSVVEGNIEVGVELFDWQYIFSTHLCAPPPTESQKLLANWELGHEYLQKIIQLFEEPHKMFQAMTPIGRCSAGQREYEWSIVIFFDAFNAEDDRWDSIEESIRSILPSHIGIEIQQRAGSLFCSNNDANTQQSLEYDQPSWISAIAERYKQEALPGCQISPLDKHWIGTLGGYVITEDKETGKRTTYGVTNAHVVRGDKGDFTICMVPAESGIKMQSPGIDLQAYDASRLRNCMSLVEKELSSLRSVARMMLQRTSLRRHTRQAIEIKEKELAFYKTHLDLVEKDRCIGLVQNAKVGNDHYFVGEPLYGVLRQVMDIALINMNCEKPWERSLMESANDPMIPEGTPYHSWEADYLGSPIEAEQHIKVVAKLGKGFYRMGIVSEFRGVVGFQDDFGQWQPIYTRTVLRPPRYEMVRGTGTEIMDLTRLELSMLETWEKAGSDHESDLDSWDPETSEPIFCEPGDSGSFVIAAADFKYGGYSNRILMPSTGFSSYANVAAPMPFIVGLLWGHSQKGGVSWMVPFDAVKQEIESMTGEKMVWPQKRTEYMKVMENCRFENDMDEGDMDET